MPETKITLYTDVISPFGYLAWHILNVGLLQYLHSHWPAYQDN